MADFPAAQLLSAQPFADKSAKRAAGTLTLPALIDTPLASPLRTSLMAAVDSGEPIWLDGSEVVRIGQAGLQVLYAGKRAAAANGIDFQIDNPSTPLIYLVTLAGLADLLAT